MADRGRKTDANRRAMQRASRRAANVREVTTKNVIDATKGRWRRAVDASGKTYYYDKGP